MVSQPVSEVSWSGESGTRVHWCGGFANTKSRNFGVGLPSMLNSVVVIS